ncbi:hypothetical protein KC725_00330 [Candidatus Peregrinibacteria bacterium]|nr:hypothetical protein [Candidatus Peregrinibacteria bacterium]
MNKHIFKNRLSVKKTFKNVCTATLITSLIAQISLAATQGIWPDTITPSDRIVTNETGPQAFPHIVQTSDGNYLVEFLDFRNGNEDLYMKKISSTDGSFIWPNDVQITSDTGTDTYGSLVADNAEGGIMTWKDANDEIYVLKINSSGATTWGPINITSDASYQTGDFPILLHDGSGGAYLGFRSTDLLLTHLDSTGALDSTWNTGASDTYKVVTLPDPVSGSGGNIVQIYEDSFGSIFPIYSKVIGADLDAYVVKVSSTGTLAGAPWDGPLKITTNNSGGTFTSRFDSSDNIYLGYTTNAGETKVQKINSSGSLLWGTGTTLDATAGEVPGIELDGGGGILATWPNCDGAHCVAVANHIISGGTLDGSWSGPVEISDNGDAYDEYTIAGSDGANPIITDGNGGAFIAFTTEEDDTIRVQHLLNDGSIELPYAGIVLGSTSPGSDGFQTMISDGNNRAVVVWAGLDSSFDVYSQLISEVSPTLCGALLDNDDSGGSTISEGCISLSISAGAISFEDIPDSFSFPNKFSSSLPQDSFSNDNPSTGVVDVESETDDIITISDLRNSGGFDLTITSSIFVNENEDEIPLENLYIVTSCPDGDDLASDLYGSPTNCDNTTGVEFADGSTDIGNMNQASTIHSDNANGTASNSTELNNLISAYTTDGTNFDADLNDIPDTITLMESTSARLARISQALNFYLNLPANQPAGTYNILFTIDLIPN